MFDGWKMERELGIFGSLSLLWGKKVKFGLKVRKVCAVN